MSAAALATVGLVGTALPASADPAPTVTTYDAAGTHLWWVPTGVTSITVDVYGAQGGSGGSGAISQGGKGAHVHATIPVTAGELLDFSVGSQGISSPSCAPGGSGPTGVIGSVSQCGSGGGGAASWVQVGEPGSLISLLAVAGGGGGGGQNNGTVPGGDGGDAGSKGQPGGATSTNTAGGGGGQGTNLAGVGGAAGTGGQVGSPANLGAGGLGAGNGPEGGSGGGGYRGGGGGGSSSYASGTSGGGGGGGSSWVAPTATNVDMTDIGHTGVGEIVVAYGEGPQIASTTLPPASVGEQYTATFTGTGYPAPSYSVTSGHLPAGLTLSSDGTLSGTPTKSGTTTFTVTATNDFGGNSRTVTLTVRPRPTLKIGNAKAAEGTSATTALPFQVTLSRTSTVDVTVSWKTMAGTAKAGSDYISAQGRLVIPAGQTSGTVQVFAKGDRTREKNEMFSVHLSSPVNATIADGTGVGTIVNDD